MPLTVLEQCAVVVACSFMAIATAAIVTAATVVAWFARWRETQEQRNRLLPPQKTTFQTRAH